MALRGRAGQLMGILVILIPLGLCWLAFSGRIQTEGAPQLSAGVLVGSIPVILLGCELFTNAVEHVGRIFKLSHQATGGVCVRRMVTRRYAHPEAFLHRLSGFSPCPSRLRVVESYLEALASLPLRNSLTGGAVVQHGLERRPVTPEIAGSNPVSPANFFQ